MLIFYIKAVTLSEMCYYLICGEGSLPYKRVNCRLMVFAGGQSYGN
jgi:hypothetical protein